MLPDTSNARITVPSIRGTLTTLWGRARLTHEDRQPGEDQRAGQATPEASRRGRGALRRRGEHAEAQRAVGRQPPSAATLEGEVHGDAERDRENEDEQRRPDERHRLPPPLLAQLRHPDDRPDEVLIGRQRDRVDPGPPERIAE